MVELRGGAAKHAVSLRFGISGRHLLKSVPQDRVRERTLVDRNIALEHAAFRTEVFDCVVVIATLLGDELV